MRRSQRLMVATLSLAIVTSLTGIGAQSVAAVSATYDITTLAGKVASLRGTAGLQIRFSSLIEQEADISALAINPTPLTPITPSNVLSSPLDSTTVAAPAAAVTPDTAGA